MDSLLLMLLILGVLPFIVGFAARLGYLKFLFIIKSVPGVYPRTTIYALMPIGILFSVAILLSLVGDESVSSFVFYLLAVLVVVSLIWQPRWLKPTWLRWLEDNYGHVLEEMFEEARQMGVHNWEAQVKTQADLERWADSVAEKHGWQRLGERQ